MPQQAPSLIERHIDKILLALTGAFALTMLGAYLLGSPNVVRYEGREVGPRELDDAILAHAQRLERALGKVAPPRVSVEPYSRFLIEQFAGSGSAARLRPAAYFGSPIVSPVAAGAANLRLVTPLAPGRPMVRAGRSLALVEPDAEPRDVAWISIAAYADLEGLSNEMTKAGYPPYASNVYVAAVDAQRQEELSDGGRGPWQDVPPSDLVSQIDLPMPLYDDLTGRVLNRAEIQRAFGLVKQNQAEILRPAFLAITAGAIWEIPPLENVASGSTVGEADTGRPAVWVHDLSAEPGRAYRYRLRLRVWNRFVARPRSLREARDADRPVLIGEWSARSEVVTAPRDAHFFVTGRRYGKPSAMVEVWKWHAGAWFRKTFDVQVGDVIGGVRRTKTDRTDNDGKPVREDIDYATGATVVDLRLDESVTIRVAAGKQGESREREVKSTVLVYSDPVTGAVKERVQAQDRFDPVRRQLRDSLKAAVQEKEPDEPEPRPGPRPRPEPAGRIRP